MDWWKFEFACYHSSLAAVWKQRHRHDNNEPDADGREPLFLPNLQRIYLGDRRWIGEFGRFNVLRRSREYLEAERHHHHRDRGDVGR